MRIFLICILLSVSAQAADNTGALLNAAQNGDANAQFQLCGAYYLGQGVPKNEQEAFKLCKLAADQGHVEAAYNLGLFYQQGVGTGQNISLAMEAYSKAANAGHKDAKFNLLQLYNANQIADQRQRMETAEKVGIVPPLLPSDPKMGMQGNSQLAQRVQQLPAQTQQQLAATKPNPAQNASKQMACLQAAQKGIIAENCDFSTDAQQVVAAQAPVPAKAKPVAEPAQIDSLAELEQQAAQGNAVAQNNLGVMYRRGKGVEKNPQQAYALFEKAASKGSTNAMLNLANMHKLGEGTPQNLELAYAWYNLAADRIADAGAKQSALKNIAEISKFLGPEQMAKAQSRASGLNSSVPIER